MGIKGLILALFAVTSMSCISQEPPATKNGFKDASEQTLFRNFTLAVCMNTAYGESSEKLLNEASKAASGYIEFSHISLEAYDEARSKIDQWLKKDYASKHGGQIDIMKCIDLANSAELGEVFAKYDPCKNKDAWLDSDTYKRQCKP